MQWALSFWRKKESFWDLRSTADFTCQYYYIKYRSSLLRSFRSRLSVLPGAWSILSPAPAHLVERSETDEQKKSPPMKISRIHDSLMGILEKSKDKTVCAQSSFQWIQWFYLTRQGSFSSLECIHSSFPCQEQSPTWKSVISLLFLLSLWPLPFS